MNIREIHEGLAFLIKENQFKKKGSVYVRQLNDEIVQAIYIQRLGRFEFHIMVAIVSVLTNNDLGCLKWGEYVLSDFTQNVRDLGADWEYDSELSDDEAIKKVWEEKYKIIRESIIPILNKIDTIHKMVQFQDSVVEWQKVKRDYYRNVEEEIDEEDPYYDEYKYDTESNDEKDDYAWEEDEDGYSVFGAFEYEFIRANLFDRRYDTAKLIIDQLIKSCNCFINNWIISEFDTEEEKAKGIKELKEEIAQLEALKEAIDRNDEEAIRKEIFREYDEALESIRKLGIKIEKKLDWP